MQWRIQDFPEEGAPTPAGAPTYDFAKFSQKLHESERIWAPGGHASLALLLDPPLECTVFIIDIDIFISRRLRCPDLITVWMQKACKSCKTPYFVRHGGECTLH